MNVMVLGGFFSRKINPFINIAANHRPKYQPVLPFLLLLLLNIRLETALHEFGLVSSLFNNIIRRNTYDGITYGNIASGQCGNSNPISTELLYECNKNFNIDQYDFIVQNGTPGQVNAFIRRIQGVSTQNPNDFVSAGNKFSYTGVPVNSDFKGQG